MSDFLFPGNCPVCGDEPYLSPHTYMCESCMDQITWIDGARCKRCGVFMAGYGFEGLTCLKCRENDPCFLSGRCLFVLDRIGKKIIHEIKYQGVRDVLKDLPFWMERVPGVSDFIAGSYLVPVPLHRKKLMKRGFNQSQWIAQGLNKALEGKNVVADLLIRRRDTPSQTKFDRISRYENLKDAFAFKGEDSLDKKRPVTLVDDVYTTGATLDSCAQVLLEEGFDQISVFALGHG